MTEILRDGAGVRCDALPKLNTLLLEETVNWAIDSYNDSLTLRWSEQNRKIRSGTPVWGQDSWGHFSGLLLEKDENYCGTSYCIAGKALQSTGNLRFKNADGGWFTEPKVSSTVIGFTETRGDLLSDDYSKAGELVLGLTRDESEVLFRGSNSIGRVILVAQSIARSRGEELHLREVDPHPPSAA